MSQLLKEYHASNPVGQQKVVTIEIGHSAITTSLSSVINDAGYLRLAQSFTDITAAIDTSSPPTTATFSKSGFGYALPKVGSHGRQELNFQIDNVSRDAYRVLNAVKAANRTSAERAILKLRSYLMSDLNTIEESFTFTVNRFEVTRQSALVSCVFHELVNRRSPKRIYNVADYPGLTYL